MNKKESFLMVNPKLYLYGHESLKLAKAVDQIAKDTGLKIYFTCTFADIRYIKENTENIIVTTQHMESIVPGRGMGHLLPESLKEAGARATYLNHAENPITIHELSVTIQRAKQLGIETIVCADSIEEAKAIATMNPTVIVAEPTELIGTGQLADDSYVLNTIEQLHRVNPDVLINIGAGVSTADDCYHIVKLGADGTGATSGILNAKNPAIRVREMAEAIVRAQKEK